MKLHIDYEQPPEWPLERTETGKLDWRVEKMKLSKDKTQLTYNGFLTFSEIPPEVYEYRLGNRSALEWIVDQYQVSTDKRSGIVTIPTEKTTPSTSSASSARSSPSASKPSASSASLRSCLCCPNHDIHQALKIRI